MLAILLGRPVSGFTGYAQTQQPSTDSVAIARNWVSLLNAHDFDGAVALLDNDAYLILDTSVSGEDINNYQGKEQIKQALEQYAQDDTRTKITAGPEDVNGTTAWTETQSSTLWTALGVNSVDVMADAIIETGRIKSIIYELTAESAAQLANAQQNGGTVIPTPTDIDTPATSTAVTGETVATFPPTDATSTPTSPAPTAAVATAIAPTSVILEPTMSATVGGALGMPRTGSHDLALPPNTRIIVLVLIGLGLSAIVAGILLRYKRFLL